MKKQMGDNININIYMCKVQGVDWIQMTQDRVQERAFVTAVMNFRVSQTREEFPNQLRNYTIFKQDFVYCKDRHD